MRTVVTNATNRVIIHYDESNAPCGWECQFYQGKAHGWCLDTEAAREDYMFAEHILCACFGVERINAAWED